MLLLRLAAYMHAQQFGLEIQRLKLTNAGYKDASTAAAKWNIAEMSADDGRQR